MSHPTHDITDRLFGDGPIVSSEKEHNDRLAAEGKLRLEDVIRQRDGWEEAAAHFSKGMDYYRGLLDEIGNIIGREAFISDDGSIQDSVVRVKLPELVRHLKG